MSKRQLQQQTQQQPTTNDLQLSKLIDHDESTNLFEHLTEDFQDMVGNKQVLRHCVEKFLDNLVDQYTLGIIFDLHRKYKTNAYCLDVEGSGDNDDSNETDLFQQINIKKNLECVCPNCNRAVAASRFVSHLEGCMGMGRSSSRSSRNASRRVANNKEKGDTASYSGLPSDDDDDVDWNSSERKRNRKKNKSRGKKIRGTPKKSLDAEPVETLNVDIEGDDDELTNLRDMLHLQERRSNSGSPAECSDASSSPKKRDKSKKKSKTKDRSSPSTSMNMD